MSIRHQQWLCYNLVVRPDQHTSGFLYKGDKVDSGKYKDAHVFRSMHNYDIHYNYKVSMFNLACFEHKNKVEEIRETPLENVLW